MTDSYDCIVVGEDCAALSAAALIASAGLKTLLLARSNPSVLPCDLLLPCCGAVLERLKLLNPLAASFTHPGQALQIVDAHGNLALKIDGQSPGSVRFWRPAAGSLHRLLLQAAEQNGARVRAVESAVEVHRLRSNLWRVKADDSTSEFRIAATAILVDTRMESDSGAAWTEIRGQFRKATALNSQAAAIATRALDDSGWCSLTPLAGGLTGVRISYEGTKPLSPGGNLADLWEDRLVQAPVLLEHLAAAELAGELRISTQSGAGDPWGAFRDSCDLLLGEQLAKRVLEGFQTGLHSSIAAPFGRQDSTGAASRIRSSLATLFDQNASRSGGLGCYSEAVGVLNQALGDCGQYHSPFPPTGDEAILTRA